MIVAKVINKIAVVEIHGGIGGKIKSTDMEKLVNRILEDKRMRASGARHRLTRRRRCGLRLHLPRSQEESPAAGRWLRTYAGLALRADT